MPFDPTQPFETVDEQAEAPAPDVPATPPAGFSLSGVLDNAYQAAKEVGGGFVKSLLTPGGIAEMISPLPGAYRSIKEAGQVLSGTPVEEAVPESQQFVNIEQTPAFSKERFATGFGTVVQMLMAAGISKGIGAKAKGVGETVKPEEVKTDAIQEQGATQPNVDVLNPEGTKTGVGEVSADVSSEGVQARGQGAKVQEQVGRETVTPKYETLTSERTNPDFVNETNSLISKYLSQFPDVANDLKLVNFTDKRGSAMEVSARMSKEGGGQELHIDNASSQFHPGEFGSGKKAGALTTDLEGTVRHEIGHMIQNYAKNNLDDAGKAALYEHGKTAPILSKYAEKNISERVSEVFDAYLGGDKRPDIVNWVNKYKEMAGIKESPTGTQPVPGAAPSGSEPAVEFTTKKDPISGETFSAVLKAPDGTPVGEGIGDITGNKLTIRNLGIDDPAFKGKGHGVQMYEQIIAEADKRGLSVESGKSVTQDAANVYGALEKRGYEVTKNPKAVTEPDGTLTTGRGEGPVFTVKPKPVEVAPEYVPTEGEFPALKKTSTQNAVMDQERVARGAPPILRDAIKEQPKVWEEAAAELETNPNRGAEIAREAIANPDAEIAPKSEAILLRHKVEVDNRLRTNMEKSLDQNLPEGERLTAQTEASRALEDLDVVDQATAARGRAWGQFGKFRQAMANDDYSLGSMLLKKKAAKGGEVVTPEEAATITAQNKRLNDLQVGIESREARLLEANKKRVATLTEKLKGKISEKKFEKQVRKQITDPELDKMRFEYSKVREEFNKGVFADQLARRTLAQKTFGRIGETINTARAIVTGLDLSAVLRQGGFVALSHPIRAAKAMPAMFRALRSERGQFDVMREIQGRENAALYKRDKLYISETGEAQPLSKMEEAFMSRWAGKIPGVAASQRAYVTFLDRLRADSFDAMAKGLSRDGKLNPAEGKAIAEFINIATGRGSLGVTLSNASPALNTVFFAPRYVASRFQLLAGKPLWKGTAATRKMIAGEYARFLAGAGVVYGLAKAAGAELEVDPRSSDFAKIKIGNTRIDPMSGLAQASTFLAREVTGQSKQQGKIKSIRGDDVKYGSDTSANVMGRFLRSKLSPSIGAAVDVAAGENVVGEKVTPAKAAARMVTPLSPSDIVDAMKEQGIPRGAAMGLLALFGMGLQTYKPRKKSGKGAPGRERNA